MKRKERKGWLLFDTVHPGIPIITFNSCDLNVIIQWDGTVVTNIIVHVLDDDKPKAYWINLQDDGSYEGVFAPAKRSGDSLYGWKMDDQQGRWMDRQAQEAILAAMRKAISFRESPLPKRFHKVWSMARRVIENLDLINPGRSRYGAESVKMIMTTEKAGKPTKVAIEVKLLSTTSPHEVEKVLRTNGVVTVFITNNTTVTAYDVPIQELPRIFADLEGYEKVEMRV